MQMPLKQQMQQMVAPISLAAYAAWAAVWFSAGEAMARGDLLGWGVRAALLLFLVGFMFEHLIHDRIGRYAFFVLAVALAAVALFVSSVAPYSAAPILLVLLSALLAARLDSRELLLALLLVNLGLALVIFGFWPGRVGPRVVSLFAYISFQMFSALVMRYAAQAEAMTERLRDANAELIATRALLAEGARESERLRLARELHDVAGHGLTALKLNLAVLGRDARQPDQERIGICAGLADELLGNLRDVVRTMRQYDGVDLRSAIERLAAPMPKPALTLDIADGLRVSGLSQAEALLRVVQEGLTNAARHAAAQRIWVRIEVHDRRIDLELRDDGRAPRELMPGNGLTGMRERLQSVGGDLAIDRGPEGGVRLHAWIPVDVA